MHAPAVTVAVLDGIRLAVVVDHDARWRLDRLETVLGDKFVVVDDVTDADIIITNATSAAAIEALKAHRSALVLVACASAGHTTDTGRAAAALNAGADG